MIAALGLTSCACGGAIEPFDGAADTNTEPTMSDGGATAARDAGSAEPADASTGEQRPRARFVRFRAIDTEQAHGWALRNYNAQQLLRLIHGLRPSVLERYISGDVPSELEIPVAAGSARMSVSEFLAASEASENCEQVITPRVSVGEYDRGTFFTTTQHLVQLSAGPHALRFLSLDNWSGFVQTHTHAEIDEMFARLEAQGWDSVGVNDCGASGAETPDELNAYGHASFAEVGVDERTWRPDPVTLSALRRSSNIRLILLYIDFPGPVRAFEALQPDRQAEILARLASQQQDAGYTFVYNIVQDVPGNVAWDATTLFTTASGPYHGASLYEVSRSLMDQYNPVPTCSGRTVAFTRTTGALP
jgi:hypothetical protein